MYQCAEVVADPPVIQDSIKLPDLVPLPPEYVAVMHLDPKNPPNYMEPGLYGADGKKLGKLKDKVAGVRVVVEFAGVTFIWGVFREPLKAGQRGDLTFHNLPGTGPITSFFNEWDPDASAPKVGPAIFTLIASQRGRNVAKIVGQNISGTDLPAAAGFIVSVTVDMPQ